MRRISQLKFIYVIYVENIDKYRIKEKNSAYSFSYNFNGNCEVIIRE